MYENISQILEIAQSKGYIERLSYCYNGDEKIHRFSILSLEKFRNFLQEIAEETDCLEEQDFATRTLEVMLELDKQQTCIQESDIERLKKQLDSYETVEEFLQNID